jgi:hypothetical protein
MMREMHVHAPTDNHRWQSHFDEGVHQPTSQPTQQLPGARRDMPDASVTPPARNRHLDRSTTILNQSFGPTCPSNWRQELLRQGRVKTKERRVASTHTALISNLQPTNQRKTSPRKTLAKDHINGSTNSQLSAELERSFRCTPQ